MVATMWFRLRKTGVAACELSLFALMPALYLIVAFTLTDVDGPQWLGTNFENSYPYLFNALLLTQHRTPFYTDHPGTTTQVFGALCLWLSGLHDKVLVNAVLSHPESFIRSIHRRLLVLGAISFWLFPWTGWRICRAKYPSKRESVQYSDPKAQDHLLWAFLLLQPALFFFDTTFKNIIWLDSELVLIVLCGAIVTSCACFLAGIHHRWTVIAAGAICGLGIATKLTFFPWVLICLVCLFSISESVIFLGSLLLSVTCALIPIFPRLPRVFHWFFRMATHSGYYGTGAPGFVRISQYPTDVIRLLAGEPIMALFPTMATFVIWIATIGVKSARPLRNLAFRLLAAQIVSYLLIAKHANFHYMIPLFFSIGLNLFLLLETVVALHWPSVRSLLSSAALLGLLAQGLHLFRVRTPATYSRLQTEQVQQLQLYERAKEAARDSARADYYRAGSPEFALYFGNFYGHRAFGQELEKMFPNALFYNIFYGKFENYRSLIDPNVIRSRYDHLYLLGNRFTQTSTYGDVQYFDPTHVIMIAEA
ncbi:MAG: hypothetical protein JOY96_11690, partial [Verrucomicrobia bacterium]|nr:hypothetical protein [Verrucomicrobiota bacterium]